MNTGQMLLTLGAIILLSVLTLRLNNNNLQTEKVLLNTKFGVLATSLATSTIEEANSKAFDVATEDTMVTSTSQLTSPSGLGPKSGETYPNFNDFDDFDGFVRIDSTMPSAVFKIEATVAYVNPSNPDSTVSTQTWHKKITVSVSSPLMKDTVRLSSIFSYWYFR